MAKPFQISLAPPRRGEPPVTLDLATLVDTRLLVTGNSGCGKSWTLRLISEQAAKKVPTLVLDPEGEYASLRDEIDAVLIGDGGELQPDVRMSAKLARKLLELGVSAVVDLQPLKLHERRAFVRGFLDSLMGAPRKLWRPCLVLLDEAHRFCPERSAGQSEASDSVITLMSQGRKRGFCGVLATQRLSKLHKDAAAEAVNVMVGRTTLDVDVKRAIDLLGLPATGKGKIRQLEPGHWFGHGPAFQGERLDGILRFRVGKVRTKHPKAGERANLQAPKPSARIMRVLPELRELPQKAQEEARDLEAARGEIASLRRQLRAAQKGTPAPGRIRELQAEAKQLRAQLKQATRGAGAMVKAQRVQQGTALKHLDALELELNGLRELLAAPIADLELEEVELETAPATQPEPRVPPPSQPSAPPPNGAPGGASWRLLQVLLQHPDGVAKKKAAMLAKVSPRASTFRGAIADLRKRGLEAKNGAETLTPTPEAIERFGGQVEPLPEGDELRTYWLSQVGPDSASGRVLAAAYAAWPKPVPHDEIATEAGVTRTASTYRGALATLRKLELINRDSRAVKASDHLFD